MKMPTYLWSKLRESFWFLPALIVAGSVVLALGLIELDAAGGHEWMVDWPRLFGTEAAGARGMLATIAGSMMTVVGVTFSMTLVTLALASSQYTSRILRNFMSDHATQAVLGIFAGIFTYCLIVLRTIREGETDVFVPGISVAASVVLAIGGIGTLIFFIHHIASSIQASSIVASVAKETLVAVDRLFPEHLGREPKDEAVDRVALLRPTRPWQVVVAEGNGYLQSVNKEALLDLARELHTVVRMDRGIGEFVVEGTPLASIKWDDPPSEAIKANLRAAYTVDRFRTVHQDSAFGIRQLVDMALRALSPGVNDTTTAVMCVDYLSAILARLAVRDMPSARRFENGELRVISVGQTFASLVADAFDEIRGSAGGNITILVRLLEALELVGNFADRPERRRVLRAKAADIAELARRTLDAPTDRARFERRLAEVREVLGPLDDATSNP